MKGMATQFRDDIVRALEIHKQYHEFADSECIVGVRIDPVDDNGASDTDKNTKLKLEVFVGSISEEEESITPFYTGEKFFAKNEEMLVAIEVCIGLVNWLIESYDGNWDVAISVTNQISGNKVRTVKAISKFLKQAYNEDFKYGGIRFRLHLDLD